MLFRSLILLTITIAVYYLPKIEGNGKLIGGDIVSDSTKYPSQCSLRHFSDHECGCTILDDLHVMTAAHCTRVLLTSSMSVHVGTTHVNGGGQNYVIDNVIEHPGYIPGDPSTPDLAIVTLTFPFVFTSSVQPAKLPSQNQSTPTGSTATVLGWGYTADVGPLSPNLHEVELNVKDLNECAAIYQGELQISEFLVCAEAPEGGRGVCKMDEGGPLYVNGELHGVIGQRARDGSCAEQGYPDVFIRVAAYVDWILSNTQ